MEVAFGEPVTAAALEGIPGVADVRVSGKRAHLTLDGPVGDLIAALAKLPVETLSAPEPDLEEIFLGLYRGESDAP